jgi:hypothetical protein
MARKKKPIWQSKIVWLSTISIIIEMAVLLNDSPIVKPELRATIALGISLLTIVFRQLSNGESLTLKSKNE